MGIDIRLIHKPLRFAYSHIHFPLPLCLNNSMYKLKNIINSRHLKKSSAATAPLDLITPPQTPKPKLATIVKTPSGIDLSKSHTTVSLSTVSTTSTNSLVSLNSLDTTTSTLAGYTTLPIPKQQALKVIRLIIQSINSSGLSENENKLREEYYNIYSSLKVIKKLFALWEKQLSTETISYFPNLDKGLAGIYRFATEILDLVLAKALLICKSTENSEYIILYELRECLHTIEYPTFITSSYDNVTNYVLKLACKQVLEDIGESIEDKEYLYIEDKISESLWKIAKRISYKCYSGVD